MSRPQTRIQRSGSGHSYYLDGKKVPGVTTIIGNGIPKPALVNWSAKETASFVVNRLDVDELGTIRADQLLRDALEWNRTRKRPERVGNDALDRLALTNILKDVRYRDLDQAARRGTEVHLLAERLASGDEVHPPDELVGHVQSYLDFLNSWEPRNALLERVVISRRWKYMGKTDMIAEFPGKVWEDGTDVGRGLLDVKTSRSGIFPDVALQLAGYGFAESMLEGDEEIPIPEIDWFGAIHVRADGFDVYRFDVTELEHRIFLYAKQIGEWMDWKEGRSSRIMSDSLPAPLKGEDS